MNCLKMNSANLVKGGVVVLILLLSLAVFDSYGNYATSQITGAITSTAPQCPKTVTVSTGGSTDAFKNYKQGETITFIVKVLDDNGKILKTGVYIVITAGDYGNDMVLFTQSTGLNSAATASGEIRYQFPLDATLFENTRLTAAKIWIRPWAYSTATSGCKEVTSDKNFYVYAYKTEPDLAVKEIKLYYEDNGVKTYRATIANHGAALSSSFNVVVRIRNKDKGTTTRIDSTTISSLDADAEQNIPLFSLKPEDLRCGDNTIEVAIDPDGAVMAETNKANNVKPIIINKDCASGGTGTGAALVGTVQKPMQPYKIEANSMDLYPEWNLISVTPPMVGKSLADMLNKSSGDRALQKFPYACVLEGGAWLWDGTTQSYEFVNTHRNTKPPSANPVDEFSSNHVGLGLWVYVLQDEGCRFGCGTTGCLLESGVPTPPIIGT